MERMFKSGSGTVVGFTLVLIVLALSMLCGTAAGETSDEKMDQLQKTVEALTKKLEAMEARQNVDTNRLTAQQGKFDVLSSQVNEIKDAPAAGNPLFDKLHFGGYGELHANFIEGDGADQIDLHRLVMYLGYDFSDWVQFRSEWEIEHGFVSSNDDTGGEFVLEQAYFDFLLSEKFNVRAGRVLTPLGIINKWHEPTTFNSVERPSFAKYVIPTTWSSDGIGIFGNLSDSLSYEAYVVGGLDGSGFSGKDGIRGGRIKERPSLHEPAFTGRVDYYAIEDTGTGQSLRLGLSGYYGGIDNGNKGNNPGISGDVGIYSADFEYTYNRFEFCGAMAHTFIDGAEQIGNNTADEIFGWYLEGAYHFMPDEWKKGKLAKSDATFFVRYDDFDTQYKMASGVTANDAYDRSEWTVGVAFWPTPNLVIKVDYQIPDDATGNDLAHKINLGIGYAF